MGINKKNDKNVAPQGGCFPIQEVTDLKDLINSRAKIYGDKKAYLVKKEKGGQYFEISYKQLKEDVDALGTTLMDMGLEGEKIAIIGTNSYQWVVSYLAIANGIGTVVPLDKELNKEEIINLVKTASCKAVFYSEEYAKVFKDIDLEYKFLINAYEDEEDKKKENTCKALIEEGYHLMKTGKADYVEKKIDPNVMSVILFTSGTTGVAKGVMLSHKNIITTVMGIAKFVKIRENEIFLSVLPIHHTFESSMSIMAPLFQGGTTAFYEGLKYMLKNIQESKATCIVGVPLILESLYNRIWSQAKKTKKDKALKIAIRANKTALALGIDKRRTIFKSIYDNFGGDFRLLFSGAAALNPETLRGFMDLGFDVMQGYGLTECAPVVAATPQWENIYGHAGSCGKVLLGGELKIINPDESGIGEICYKGDNVMLGYYNMPEETAAVIKDDWFHTGDLGFIDQEGWLYITGRQKNVIVTRTGKNIYPEELEAKLNLEEYIAEAMVYGVDEEEGDTEVWAQIYPDYEKIKETLGIDPNEENISTLIKDQRKKEIFKLFDENVKDVNETLAVYKRIKNIIVREEDFVRTTTKKIKRKDSIKEYE